MSNSHRRCQTIGTVSGMVACNDPPFAKRLK
jgi:hypothetical protein